MFKKVSLLFKMLIFLGIIVAISSIGFYIMLNQVHKSQLRNEARTVADHVVAFRSWVAGYGVVWVKNNDDDFLGEKYCSRSTSFYSKNPALATRELSTIVNTLSSHTKFRVTSDNYRNPKNSPDDFEKQALSWFKSNKESKEHHTMEDEVFRYAAPLIMKKGCMKCHSDPSIAPRDVIEKYGSTRGFGYKIGEIRGVISVSIPTEGMWSQTMKEVGVWQLLLLLLILIVAFLFTHFIFEKPLRKLTEAVEKISLGSKENLNAGQIPIDTSNEIDKLTLAVDRLQLSMQLALRRLRKKG